MAISGDGRFPLRSSWFKWANSGRQYMLRGSTSLTYFSADAEVAFLDYFFGPTVLALGATELADTASFAIGNVQSLALTATEPADTASFAVGNVQSLALSATEPADTASFALGNVQSLALSVNEPADTASFAVGGVLSLALSATEPADTASFTATVGGVLSLALSATEPEDTASFAMGPPPAPLQVPYGGWNKRRKPIKKPPPPVQAAEVVVDEAVLRQIEEERRAAAALEARKEALRRIGELRDGYQPATPARTVTLPSRVETPTAAPQPGRTVTLARETLTVRASEPASRTINLKRFDVIETSPAIRTRVVSLLKEQALPPATNTIKGPVLQRRLGARNPPQPELAKARYVSLRRSTDQLKKTG